MSRTFAFALGAVLAVAGCASDEAMAPPAAAASAHYMCEDGMGFQARFMSETRQVPAGRRTVPLSHDTANLMFHDGQAVELEAQPVGSGIHYSGGGYDLRGKGDEATLTTPDGVAHVCRAGA